MPKIVCEKGKCIHPRPMSLTRHYWRPPSALAPVRGNQFAVQPLSQPLVHFNLQPPPFPDFHMPDHVAAKIVSLVFEDGVDMLKAWIQSGPDGKAAVFSSETLSSVRLAPFFIHMAEESSSYHMFYTKCLTAENPYALYLQRLVLAFHMFELQEVIAILDGIKDVFSHAGLLYIMLHSCDGSIPWEFYIQYKRRYYKFSEVDLFANKLMFHINERKIARLYIPEPILALIVSHVSEEGIEALKNWIKSGHDGKSAAFSVETLSRVRLDKSPDFINMSSPDSVHFSFYSKCLAKRNPYAMYLQSLRLGFRSLDLIGAISLLNDCKDVIPIANLLYVALNRCASNEVLDAFNTFKQEKVCFTNVDIMAKTLIGHISDSEPKRFGSYAELFHYEDSPDCWLMHEFYKEYNGERCSDCIYYFLFGDILLIS
ncbi:putative protein [Arabidopsis thaliana]|uniref:Uncharacterized protein F7M19_80 n=1 Tax=Arabidopsis thaliana TaxID=3702 RepID=Q9M254_ARATH|nr:putative protein [Arabidopsis thaliana]